MNKLALLGAVALGAMATSAQALTLSFASVTGPTGTVWDTNNQNTFYNLFLSNPFGNALNPNDNFSGFTVTPMMGDFDIAGDGFPTQTTDPNQPKETFNSDPFYNLTLNLTEGGVTQTLSATYTVATNIFTANNSVTFGRTSYTISGFNFDRSKRNIVGAYTVDSRAQLNGPGSAFDYQGTFGLAATAVPEPAAWAMMIAGFGLVGSAMRRRRSTVRIAFA